MRRIEATLKRDGILTGIFLRVDPSEEIAPEEQYRVIMRPTAREEIFEQPQLEARVLELTEAIRQEFDSIDGIEIIDYELVSEADFSLADLREHYAGTTTISPIEPGRMMTRLPTRLELQ